MAADLTEETGIHDAGLDAMMQALTGPAEPAELAGEQSAIAMFRASLTPSADVQGGRGRAAGWAAAPRRFATRPIQRPTRWNLRLAAAAAVVVLGGMAAAAYAAALPAPVQRLAHDVFQFAGVPGGQAGSGAGGSGHGTLPAGQQPTQPAGGATPGPSGVTPYIGAPGPSASTGTATLSAAAASTEITAGTSVVITGQLSWPGHVVSGVTMTLLERPALTLAWRVVGSVPAGATGNGAVTVPVLGTDADFRLAVSGAAISPAVRVNVIPVVSVAVDIGGGGSAAVVTVSAPWAERGDLVVLQSSANGGASWTYLRQGSLTVLRRTSFLLSASRLSNDEIRAVLLPTGLHAGSVSSSVTMPPSG
jgi:hypothetical protein